MTIQFQGIHVFKNISHNPDAAAEAAKEIMTREVLPVLVENYEADQLLIFHGRDLQQMGEAVAGLTAAAPNKNGLTAIDPAIFTASEADFRENPLLAISAHNFLQQIHLALQMLHPKNLANKLNAFLSGLNGTDTEGSPIQEISFKEAN